MFLKAPTSLNLAYVIFLFELLVKRSIDKINNATPESYRLISTDLPIIGIKFENCITGFEFVEASVYRIAVSKFLSYTVF